MRKLVVTCDRCGATIQYNTIMDKLTDGAIFMMPTLSAKGEIIADSKQVELCKNCVWDLNKFMSIRV